ncbi:MAG: aminotransferase [Spirochaetes bacterium GWD1_27_9]|nr:MAG: aminotransferase [Spirochaetes bacterium GWB1_27_13]OHD27581.1 MAG: aminotransferase [Spirochaetes bacterium GWC1_27_15]OHD42779.1 MAG: aminotransferase [Spirochaetes bacterium GWD1_27_9]
MRRELVPAGAESLSYEIREIVVVANELKKMGLELVPENIGDPTAKGEKIVEWIKDEIKKLVDNDNTWGYCDTQGVLKTREFVAEQTNKEGGIQISPNDVYFFNGLGDAVAKIFGFLKREARVIGPTPAYSTHSSAEAAHSGYEHLTYTLNPDKDWEPDVDEIYNKAKYNDSIAGILLINPGNPTGAVIKRETLKRICEIAEELNLFVVCDEMYSEIVYSNAERVKLSTVIGNACGMSLNGISKQIPWPGSRCGWIEVYNKNKDKEFEKYIETILKAKRLEVCSTTLPQMAIPLVLGNPMYKEHLKMRSDKFEKRAKEASLIFNGHKGIRLIEPKGAFYMAVLFDEKLLNPTQTLPIANEQIKKRVEELCSQKHFENDKRFVYYLLGSTGIITVPMTGFYSKLKGIRLTLLEENDEKRQWIFTTIRDKMLEYIK